MKLLGVLGFAAFIALAGRHTDAYIMAGIWVMAFVPYFVNQVREAVR